MDSCCLFMVSMHRSGNSLLAKWLKECGLDIGKRLTNYQDRDFLEFHELMLAYNGASMYTGLNRELNYDKYLYSKAKSILFLKNLLSDQWGMNQPRATLFLNLWNKVNQRDTFYISLVRDFWEVVSSLYLQEQRKIAKKYENTTILDQKLKDLEDRKQEFCDLFLSMWIRYNEEIIKFYPKSPKGNHLVFWMDKLVTSDKLLFDYITNEWGFDLNYVPISDIYEPDRLHKLSATEFDFSPELQQRAIETEHKLKEIERESGNSCFNPIGGHQ